MIMTVMKSISCRGQRSQPTQMNWLVYKPTCPNIQFSSYLPSVLLLRPQVPQRFLLLAGSPAPRYQLGEDGSAPLCATNHPAYASMYADCTFWSGEGFESIRIMRTTETFIILQVTISDFELFFLEPLFRLTRFIKRRLIL